MNSNFEQALAEIERVELEGENSLDLSEKGLSNEQFAELIPTICKLPLVDSLDLSKNHLTTLPFEIGQLPQLILLDLSNNELETLPSEISQLIQLKELQLTHNKLATLPPEICQLSQLSSLYLSNNQLSSLPSRINQLFQLTSLTLSNNNFSDFPLGITELCQLTTLHISNNQITSLPTETGKLSSLITLDVNGNQITGLPSEIGRLSRLNKLSISGNRLTTLPPEIGRLSQLTRLDLFENGVTDLPPEIGQLSQLGYFELGGNELTSLPSEICRLSKLAELDLFQNKLTVLPLEICQLSQLTKLHLSDNYLTTLPSEIGRLSQLTYLDLFGNYLTTLPPEIGRLSQLTYLDISSNQLTGLPLEIGRLSQLTYLDIADNQLTGLPPEIGLLTLLTELDLSENPLRFPPSEVAEIGIRAIRKYLGTDYFEAVWQSKCVVVGEGGVGKTWLIDALSGNQPDKNIVGTIGIDILPLALAHPDQSDTVMQLNCWDFAGQDFNHAMHQFFFSNRALILLVWNARHGWQQGKLTRWLENIKVRAPEAPVLLVATHIDEPHSDYPKAQLQADYPQIKAVIEVSSKTGTNIVALRDLIQREAAALPLMGVKWPSTWLDAAQAVRALAADSPYTTRSHAYTVMREHGLDDAQCAILLRWLHELGDLLNFADEEKIADWVILNPEWLTKYLGIVLRSDEVLVRKGVLARTHLRDLWRDLDEQIRTLFLHIMDKFDLAYLIPDDPDHRSLIVERLPQDPPDYAPLWAEYEERGSEITLRFKLGSMQPGIPTWFIARCHRFTLGRGDAEGMHWLNGVLFQDEQSRHRALIIADDHRRTVEMRVRGPFPQRFMSLLRDGFRDTLKRYKGLEVERWVPCNGYNELEEKVCGNEFRLDQLELWLEKRPNRLLFTCPECDTEHSRLALVEGVGSAALTQSLTEQRIIDMVRSEGIRTRRHMDVGLRDMARFVERNFLRQFKLQQASELLTCPNLFTIRQKSIDGVIVKNEWYIQLYCQEPSSWHRVGEPYIIKEQREIIGKVMPYLKLLLKTLKVVAPLAGVALALADVAGDVDVPMREWADEIKGDFENEVKLMGEFVKATAPLAEIGADDEGALMRSHPSRREFEPMPATDLAPVRQLMDILAAQDAAAGKPKWRGLKQTFTPEGDILWLDEAHLQTYLSQRKRPEDVGVG